MRNDFFIIDAHQHVGSLNNAKARVNSTSRPPPPPKPGDETRARLGTMNNSGVDQAVVMPSHAYLRPRGLEDTRDLNTNIAAYRDSAPDRFLAAVGIVEPLYGPQGIPELTRIADLGLVGVSFHTRFQGCSTSSPLVFNLVERMGQLGLIPFVHAMAEIVDESMLRVLELAAAFPELTMVVLDAFSTQQQAFDAMIVAEHAPNLIFDTSFTPKIDPIQSFIRAHGADRICYGTNLYSHANAYQKWSVLDELLDSDLTREQLAAVLSGNIRRVLKLPETA